MTKYNDKKDKRDDKRKPYTPSTEKSATKSTAKPPFKQGERSTRSTEKPAFKSGERSTWSAEKPAFKQGERSTRSTEKPAFKSSERSTYATRSTEKPAFKSSERSTSSTRSTQSTRSTTKPAFKPWTKPAAEPRPVAGSIVDVDVDDDIEVNECILEGRNPVLEALNSGRSIDKILVKKGEIEGTLKLIVAKAKEQGVVVQEVHKQRMDDIAQTSNYQGVIAYCASMEYVEITDILAAAREKNEEPFLLVLDGITDPHNLGAIIRTANASGVHGVIIPKRRAVGLTSTVNKAASGALEYVKVAKVTNIARAIDDLKKEGIWIACTDTDGENYFGASLNGPLAIVIGNEGEGVGRLIKEKCDFVVNIPMYGEIGSLNASVAAGLVMYEVVRQRRFK